MPRLRALADARASSSLVPAKWSPKQILGHVIDSAANNHQRFVRVQAESDLNLPGYAQDFWVDTQRYSDRAWSDLIDLWASYNRHLAHVITHIAEAKGSVLLLGLARARRSRSATSLLTRRRPRAASPAPDPPEAVSKTTTHWPHLSLRSTARFRSAVPTTRTATHFP